MATKKYVDIEVRVPLSEIRNILKGMELRIEDQDKFDAWIHTAKFKQMVAKDMLQVWTEMNVEDVDGLEDWFPSESSGVVTDDY